MNYNRNQVDGDLAVRNNAVIGGDQTVRGSQQINGDLKVSGVITGAEVSSKDMGLFLTESALKEAVPVPTVGMYAAVGSGFPAALYRCDTAGTWTSAGSTVNYNVPTSATQQAMKAAASSLVSVEQTRAEFVEDTIKTSVSTEAKERKAEDEEIAKMLRRLAVFITDHHKHDLNADWLWKEMLLGMALDTEKDILTLCGIQYQLTRVSGGGGGGSTTTDTYWYGWNADPSVLVANLSFDYLKAQANGSGSASKSPNTSFSCSAGNCVWMMYPKDKSFSMSVKQNGYEASVSWYDLGEVTDNGTTYIVKAFDITGDATIASITI